MKITGKLLKKPLVIKLVTLFIIIVGFIAFKTIALEKHPDVQIPKIIIMVPYAGAEPAEIEEQIIRRLEERLKKIPDLKEITSYAKFGKAVIRMEFDLDVDIDQAKIDVKNAFDEAKSDMPSGIDDLIMKDIDLADRPVLSVSIYGDTDLRTLRTIADNLQTVLETTKGVSEVTIYGGYEREIQIKLDPLKMKANNLSITEIITFIQNSNISLAGGQINIRNKDYPIKISGRIKNIYDFRDTILKYQTTTSGKSLPVRLKDIAIIQDTSADIETISRYNGLPNVNLSISKRRGENTLKISKRVKQKLKVFNKRYLVKAKLRYAIIGDDSEAIIRSTNDLFSSMWQGVLAILIVLSIAMGLRNGFISALAIPFCFIATMAALYFMNYTLNSLVQFGLIIVIGMVVDGALVVMENIYRHREMGKPITQAVIDAVDEIGASVITSDLTTIAAFIPLMFMTGTMGRFFSYIPIGVIAGLTASLFFDHFIIPILAQKYMSDPNKKVKFFRINQKKKKEPSFFKTKLNKILSGLSRIYSKTIIFSLKRKAVVLLLTTALLIVSLIIIGTIPKRFFPRSNEDRMYMSLNLSPISSIEETDKIVKNIEKNLLERFRKMKVIEQYVVKIGQPSNSINRGVARSGENTAKVTIDLYPIAKRKNYPNKKLMGAFRRFTSKIAGVKFNIEFKRRRPSSKNPINVTIRGEDLRVLKMLSKKVQQTIKENVPNAVDLEDNYGNNIPQFEIKIKRKKANLHGISVSDIATTLSVFFNGKEVSDIYSEGTNIKIKLKLQDKYIKNTNSLNKVYIYKSSTKTMIPLTEVVDINIIPGIPGIVREDMKRTISVVGNVYGKSSTEVMIDIRRVLADFPLPVGYSFRYRGENEDREASFASLRIAFAGAIIVIFLIIALQLGSTLQPVSILVTILLSIIGVAFGLFISNSPFGIMAMLGMVSLAGVVVNDAIVLITYINQLRKSGLSREHAIQQACKIRLRPILLTTFTTIAGLMPLATGLGGSDSSYWGPMAWTMIIGLLFATFQTLVVVPIVYSVLEDFMAWLKRKVIALTNYAVKLFALFLRKVFKVEYKYEIIKEEISLIDGKEKSDIMIEELEDNEKTLV